MATKVCFKCGVEKNLSEFYRHKMMSDGHLNKCKECAKKDVRRHRSENLEKINSYDRERSKTPERKKKVAEYVRRRRKKDLQKFQARAKLEYAVKSGRIQRGLCEVCGSPDVEAHHDDYSKPLEVRWFCFKHHLHEAHEGDFKNNSTSNS